MDAKRLEIERSGTRLLPVTAGRALHRGLGSLAVRWRRVDLSVAGTFALGAAAVLAIAVSLLAAPDARGVLGGALAVVMIAIAAIDAREFVIPDALTVAALALGLGNPAVVTPADIAGGLSVAMLRGAALALLFLILQAGYRRLRGHEGLGSGDVKLAGVAGIWLDWLAIPPVIEIAALAAIAFFVHGYFAGGGRALRLTSRLPFGLFLAPAIWLGWLIQTLSGLSP
jgi:leader peptidase (prepilin peptidase) / N-methyltransferase